MNHQARGRITSTVDRQPPYDDVAGAELARVTVVKRFEGDLDGAGMAELLRATSTQAEASGGYVAFERVTGTLAGRRGSFVLQYYATINRGDGRVDVAVVPDSGTEELVGISGKLVLGMDGGQQTYEFEYELPAEQ
ncbi:uncharacterized protein DUF3224 [Herbihabitans rhizosphaerae]|uniref:Uncharacterized protein DUF3224 n=1 Tax=Herbihabitans rhizosphaerae TaxID=1872711 RepID=A0A4Q7L3R4_9PSEU|nr:DUF3224 domain-containing protein [Herbihabitans rhizosphaerae]RZS43101.1 uncharacterized protein DUF3224 [Herbihabitans rhizosphaerae]